MPELKNYKLFISHSWNYSERYERAVSFLNAANNFQYSNFSIPEDRKFLGLTKSQLQEELRGQIRPVQAVLIIGGMYINHSDWIQFEIDFAKSLGKPIIGITPWSGQRMPEAVRTASDIIVGWNTSTIVQAIRDYAL